MMTIDVNTAKPYSVYVGNGILGKLHNHISACKDIRQAVMEGIQIVSVPVRERKGIPKDSVKIIFCMDVAAVNEFIFHHGSPYSSSKLS